MRRALTSKALAGIGEQEGSLCCLMVHGLLRHRDGLGVDGTWIPSCVKGNMP